MTDKRCGTCAHTDWYKYDGEIVHHTVTCDKVYSCNDCEDWQERTDSIELIALELLSDIYLIRQQLSLYKWFGSYPDDYVRRLKNLGVNI